MKTNLEWFRSFKAIYETGTLTAAAKQLALSQPGVSLHLNSLEVYTGFPLFERKSKKMYPTEKGKILYNQVENLLTSFDSVEELLHRKSGDIRPTVSVGVCVELFQYFLEDQLYQFDFNLIAKFDNDDYLRQLLEKNILDFIITNRKNNEKDWEYEDFFVEKLVLVAGKNADVATIQNLMDQKKWSESKDWLRNQKWYGTAADMEHVIKYWKVHFNETPDFSPNFIVPNKFSILKSLSNDNAFSVLPAFLCKNHPHIHLINSPKEVNNPLYLCKRKKLQSPIEINWITQFLHEKAKNLLNDT
ncbi:LysR family transcriptional regulator [Chryseobacterium gotjawalense]|uniref:LysR family transcriptional regulator n=1 Tax=Chryseobacterium gotjawalense TaxID=3042315 RepID=A0ABY8RHY8_9FLAO|nr:LysR family transcriptional regulator [Chryseobacterium sp. wdc7]WHF52762.1 LysR family transcriptional regulator [Chryseobacterium sp. wdc7]